MQKQQAKKEDQLHVLRERFSHVTDRLGKGIDPGIFETVVLLNALGFRTTGSCEGHLHEGSPAPWVDLAVEVPPDEHKQAVEALREADRQETLGQLPKAERARLHREAQDRFHALDSSYQTILKRLLTLLTAFYHDRHVPYDQQLTVRWYRSLAGTVNTLRLENQGAELLPLESFATRTSKLRAYQAEMEAFTAFLAKHYQEND